MWWVIGTAAVAILIAVLRDWRWERDWSREDIPRLKESPGVYVLHYPKSGRARVGSTNNLKRRLGEHRGGQWETFDWHQTKSTREARSLERKLQRELNERS